MWAERVRVDTEQLGTNSRTVIRPHSTEIGHLISSTGWNESIFSIKCKIKWRSCSVILHTIYRSRSYHSANTSNDRVVAKLREKMYALHDDWIKFIKLNGNSHGTRSTISLFPDPMEAHSQTGCVTDKIPKIQNPDRAASHNVFVVSIHGTRGCCTCTMFVSVSIHTAIAVSTAAISTDEGFDGTKILSNERRNTWDSVDASGF